jgi:hypothetical protein
VIGLCYIYVSEAKNMTLPITEANVASIFDISKLDFLCLQSKLALGNLYSFETDLRDFMTDLYTNICEFYLVGLINNAFYAKKLKELAIEKGFKKLSKRSTSLQIGNGKRIKYEDYYAEEVPPGYSGERFLSHLYFKNVGKCSLFYTSHVSEVSLLTPSFAVGEHVLADLGIASSKEGNRLLSQNLGNLGLENRVENMLAPSENVVDKRVIIGIDGGRTRTRDWKEKENEADYGNFNTPWVEPKLLVISILDKEGKMEKKELPIYDACFGDDELIALLSEYLGRLQIDKAARVQVVADGAIWIWNRVKPMLLNLGVKEDKIVETVDYYHAVEHLTELKGILPKETQEKTLKEAKEQLWKGNISEMKNILLAKMTQTDKEQILDLQYFEKNIHRMQYLKFTNDKLPVGSGIVESAIRRVINLRFKCPSAFWNKQNLEPLFFLRAVFLTRRRNIFFNNLNAI